VSPAPHKRVQTVLLAAVECHDTVDRTAILDRECLAESELRPRVEAVLKAYGPSYDSLKQPRVGSDDRDKP